MKKNWKKARRVRDFVINVISTLLNWKLLKFQYVSKLKSSNLYNIQRIYSMFVSETSYVTLILKKKSIQDMRKVMHTKFHTSLTIDIHFSSKENPRQFNYSKIRYMSFDFYILFIYSREIKEKTQNKIKHNNK